VHINRLQKGTAIAYEKVKKSFGLQLVLPYRRRFDVEWVVKVNQANGSISLAFRIKGVFLGRGDNKSRVSQNRVDRCWKIRAFELFGTLRVDR